MGRRHVQSLQCVLGICTPNGVGSPNTNMPVGLGGVNMLRKACCTALSPGVGPIDSHTEFCLSHNSRDLRTVVLEAATSQCKTACWLVHAEGVGCGLQGCVGLAVQ